MMMMILPAARAWAAGVWAGPWTLVGLAMGLVAIATGGGAQRVGRVWEFYGGWLDGVLRWVPIRGGAAAMTLGQAVIARSRADLARSREHELVHVAQYERWGPLFVPAYLACSVWLWLRGRDPYLDVGSSRVDLQACKLEYSIVSPK